MNREDHDDPTGLPRTIPVPTPDGRGFAYKSIDLCSEEDARFYLGFLLYRTYKKARTVDRLKANMRRRYGHAPDSPVLLSGDGRPMAGLPAWITPHDVLLYAQLDQEGDMPAEDEGDVS